MTGDRGGTGEIPVVGPRPERRRTAAGGAFVDIADWATPPPGSERAAFPAPSGELATLAMGPPGGEPVVLVPGLTGSKEDFSLMLPSLAAAGMRVVSFDLAGQYESAAAGPERLTPPRPRYDFDLFVGDLLAVLEAQRAPAHVLGYSFAGIVAQLALARRPELFASLTLLSCPPEPGEGFRDVPVIGRLSAISSARVAATVVMWALRTNLPGVPPARARFVRHRFTRTRRQSVDDAFALMKRTPDLRGTLRAAALPKLVAVGEHDVWPLELHRRFAGDIGARLSVYPGGHSPCETSPLELADDMLHLIRGGA